MATVRLLLRLSCVSVVAGVCCALANPVVGRVVADQSGNALASAEVRVILADSAQLAADLETDSDGRFELPNLPAGKYRLEVSKPNYLPATLALPADPLIVRLIQCGVISGRVLDSQGQPVRSATVFVMSRPSEGANWRQFARFDRGHQARVNEDGEYRLFNLPPGRYAVAVTYGASVAVVGSTGASQTGSIGSGVVFYPGNSQPRIFSVSGGEEYRDVDFALTPVALYRVSGKINLESPNSGYWLALTLQNQPAFATAVTQASDDGSFHFEGIPPGSYSLFAFGPSKSRGPFGIGVDEHSMFGRMPLELGGDMDGVQISLQKGRAVSLVLRNSDSANHACSASIEFALSPLEDSGADLERTLVIGFDKPVRTDPLPPGHYLLTPRSSAGECHAPNSTTLDLNKVTENSPIVIPVEHHADK